MIYANIQQFIIEPNEYLKRPIRAFYRCDYLGYQQPNNPDYINTLKNTFNYESNLELKNAQQQLANGLVNEIHTIMQIISNEIGHQPVTICVVPRSKRTQFYKKSQLLFKHVIFGLVEFLKSQGYSHFENGVEFITRHTDTCTTHLQKSQIGGGNGSLPYVGITKDTCIISPAVHGKNIILIDDIYTKSVNIDEDCIQALLDNGAKNVYFFAIARTLYRKYTSFNSNSYQGNYNE